MAYDPAYSGAMGTGAGTAVLSTKLDLSLSARNLPKLDYSSPSDPFIAISIKPDGGRFEQIGTTEIVWDNHNPNFTKEITLEYRFEEVQTVRLDVYDADQDSIGRDMSKHDYVGYCEFILGDCVTADGQKLAMKLVSRSGRAVVCKSKPSVAVARVQELSENKDELFVTFGVKDLPKMDWFGKSDPFLEIYRQTEGGDWSSMHRTEHHDNTLKCTFRPVTLAVRRLCNGDVDRPILIRCFDWNKSSAPDFIGECQLSLAQLTGETSFTFYDPSKKKAKSKTKARGTLLIVKQKLVEKFSFYQFITGGLDINLMIAIDFTGSNGDPRDPKSLHFMGPPKYESDYMRVIKSVVRILESYDSDGMIPVFGFGANIAPPGRMISHCFPLTFLEANPEVHGFEGVIHAYQSALKRVQLYGPTYFSEILGTARMMSCHEQTADHLHYTILLIITDGIINDMSKTIDEIVAASHTSALAVIIVGVGKGDPSNGFSAMEQLDADETPLVAKGGEFAGKRMAADIVQFVEFEQYKGKHVGALAKEVLLEVPGQCEEYMSRRGLRPMRPKLRTASTLADLYGGPQGLVAQDTMYNPMAAGMAPAGMAPMGMAAMGPTTAPAVVAPATMAAPPTLMTGTSHAHLAYNPYYSAGP